ncbi:uncharacterized protein LOC122254975 [Penaeus japonicus]|uniref:uncharacterized protein LOC122254975 n=1 Tax=Penaeus japonicus TaxID=27405 RepID=UPI001C711073|nr:uncharacterized protein LOC122254975 [Penaeus japonicus]
MANTCDLNCECHDLVEALDNPPCYTCAQTVCSVAGKSQENLPLQYHLDPVTHEKEPTADESRPREASPLVTIEVSRNWYTRLGIILAQDEKNRVVIRDILPGTLAAHDGRLRVGDVLLKVDEQNLAALEMSQVYDFLRRCGNTISFTVLPATKGVREGGGGE